MRKAWNIDPKDPITILRLISELEGSSHILACIHNGEEDHELLEAMKEKYYKLYWKMRKEWKENET